VPVQLHGPGGCLPHLERVIARKGHATVVVAEGAGEELLGESAEVDAGGNKKLPAIGEFMVKQIKDHFASIGSEATVGFRMNARIHGWFDGSMIYSMIYLMI
jgi:6-phosphofructokinase 1